MKVVIFNAGLGNQIFTYLFINYLKKRFPREKIFGCYWSGGLNDHYGLELDKVFNIALPLSSLLSDILGKFYRLLLKLGFRNTLENNEYAWWNPVFDYQWIDQQYFKDEEITKILTFKEENISERNIAFTKELENRCSVAVHVRRGDYLRPDTYENFGRFCTKEYYIKAIDEIKKRLPEAKFYFFSDDIDYVKAEFPIEGASFVDWNKDSDSWQDMYLMSRCKNHIIANSTFSYWAAQLSVNNNENHIVIAPKKWYIWDDPDIFPENWIRL